MCTPNQTAKTIAKILVEKWFHVYGVPSQIHSDQGRCFDSNIIKALCKMYGVEQSFTFPYNPHGNAFCERFNRTLFGLLKTLKSEEKADWPFTSSSFGFCLQCYTSHFNRLSTIPTYVSSSCSGTL